ncbi:hypothetical protein BDZ45DRAFT_187069 [Acephala macrosclerotiorum]|nr:hypothetical protein BDZ45DRAFT_187069 [Acephala macrosclerotiorum]
MRVANANIFVKQGASFAQGNICFRILQNFPQLKMTSIASATTTSQGSLTAPQFDSISLSNAFQSLPTIIDLPDVPRIDTVVVYQTSHPPLVASDQLDTLLSDTAAFLKSLQPFPFPTFDDQPTIVRAWISDLILSDTFYKLDPQIKAHSPLVKKVSWDG